MDIKEKQKEAILASIQDLYTFTRNFWHVNNSDEFVDNWHIREICHVLNAYGSAIAQRQYIDDLIINIPPGMSKSTILNHMFPMWLWLHSPSTVFITSCYASGLSDEHSQKCKNIFKSDRYQEWFQEYFQLRFGKTITLIKDTVMDWSNNFNGRRYNTYTGGPVTGIHAHCFIYDDPMNVEMTYYANAMAKAHRFYDKTLPTRKKNKKTTPTLYVMQRLHNDDTTGHELEKTKLGKKIFQICLPAELNDNVKPESFKKFYVNGLMDPNRCDAAVLASQKMELGSGQYSGQYLQVPVDEKGGLVKTEWFKRMPEKDVPFDIVWDMWIDGAYTDKAEANDPTGIMIAGFHHRTNKLYVKRFVSKYMELPALLRYIPDMFYLNGYGNQSRAFLEPKASGKSIKQMITDQTKIPAIEIRSTLVQEGKKARINVATPKYESSRIIHVDDPGIQEFEDQLAQYPAHKHDEAVDLIGYACDYYFGKGYSEMYKGS